MRCQADVGSGWLTCRAPAIGSAGLPFSPLIVGGQGVNVQLTSSNVSYDEGTEIFQADVTVQNLMNRTLGTPDGSTVDGIRVFFHTGPVVTVGTGTVTVREPDGTGSFTGSNQPYYAYMEILASGETSNAKTWEWDVPSTVETFVFEVFVDAESPAPITIEWGPSFRSFDQCFGPYTWSCTARATFTVTDGSGELWVKAAGKPGSGTYPVVPDRFMTSILVSPRMRYRVTLAVSFWGTGGSTWPRTMANWPCARFAITSAAATADTVFKELNPQLDTYYFPPQYFCSAEYEIGNLTLTHLGVADTARAGDWEAAAPFGEFVFTVNEDGSAITAIDYSFDDFSCGGTIKSGSVGFTGNWPITDHQFTIENTDPANGDTYTVQGEFDATEVDASGTWELDLPQTACSGSWVGQWNLPPIATIHEPQDGASYQFGETVTFSGSGEDPEDGALTGGSLTWTSNQDGQIGTGATLTHNDLSVGNHRIILTARDSEGWTGKDTVYIAIRAAEDFATGTWQAPTEFGQFSIVVNPERTGITAISYELDHWGCGWESGQWWYGDGVITEDYPGWPITDGHFSIQNTLIDPDLVIWVQGDFETAEHASGTWTGRSNGTYCYGDWEGNTATKLFLRAGTTPFLSTEQDMGSPIRSRGQSGTTWQFAATLDEAIAQDTYTFWLWLRADSGGTGSGDFDAALSIDHEGAETELASTSFHVSADTLIVTFMDEVTGLSGGVAGDQLILRISYDGDGWGDVGYGEYGSHVIILGHVATSMPSASFLTAESRGIRPVVAVLDKDGTQGLRLAPWRRK